jgi:dTMP kinase
MERDDRGRFIVLEGLDGAGTSTQIELLAASLRSRGIEAGVTREPTDGHVGRLVRQVLRKEIELDPAALALLFAADRVDHLETAEGVKAALQAGRWLLSDRYVLSSVAYQAADGLDPAWVVALNRRAIAPDLTVFVAADPEVCMQRIEARGARLERFETLERLRLVEAHFRANLTDESLTGALIEVDGNGTIDDVAKAIDDAVTSWLEAR